MFNEIFSSAKNLNLLFTNPSPRRRVQRKVNKYTIFSYCNMESETIYFIVPVSLFLIVGIILFLKSIKNESKSLRAGITFPLINFLLAFFMIFFGKLIYILIFTALPLSILGIIFSIIATIKIEKKTLPVFALLYSFANLVLSLFFYSNITM